MQNIIQFSVRKEDNVYSASAVNAPIVTEGNTFEDLVKNIREAVSLFFEGEDFASLGFSRFPSILTNIEISPENHGVNA